MIPFLPVDSIKPTADADTMAVSGTPHAAASDSIRAAASDSVSAAGPDSIPEAWGIALVRPPEPAEPPAQDTSMSWLFAGLLFCFVVVAVRFRNNGRYMFSLWKDITEVKERRNVFDDTVSETSFLVLLNILWIAEAAILLGCLLTTESPAQTPGLPLTVACRSLPVSGAYTLLMFFAYWLVGNVFSDSTHTHLWVRGYAATNGILSVYLFPITLLILCYPSESELMLILAATGYILAKILFLYKGFRIFFSQGTSWVLFLYYLCSLEIVPLAIAYAAASGIDRIW